VESDSHVSEPGVPETTAASDKQSQRLVLKALSEHRAPLIRLAYRFCWNNHDAEDAVQNATIAATGKAGQLREPRQALSWIRSIVIREALAIQRQAARRRDRPSAHADGIASTRAAELSDDQDRLRRLLLQLPERQRLAVVLRHLESAEYDDIATLMDISPATARVLVRNGRESLRQLMFEE
jgi:RNA polymerase sigma-70 factor (ECF subfamily)